MAEHPNVLLLRRVLEAFATGDMAVLDELFADEVKLHQCGNHPLSGHFDGKQAVFAHWAALGQVTAGNMRIEVHDVVGGDDHVVALVNLAAGRPDGRTYDDLTVIVAHVRGEKFTELWGIEYDQAAQNTFFSA